MSADLPPTFAAGPAKSSYGDATEADIESALDNVIAEGCRDEKGMQWRLTFRRASGPWR